MEILALILFALIFVLILFGFPVAFTLAGILHIGYRILQFSSIQNYGRHEQLCIARSSALHLYGHHA